MDIDHLDSSINRRIEERSTTQFPAILFKPGFQTPITVIDISEHGIGFLCSERLQPDDIIEIQLTRNESTTFKAFTIFIEIRNRFVNERVERYGAKILNAPDMFQNFLPKLSRKRKLSSTLSSLIYNDLH